MLVDLFYGFGVLVIIYEMFWVISPKGMQGIVKDISKLAEISEAFGVCVLAFLSMFCIAQFIWTITGMFFSSQEVLFTTMLLVNIFLALGNKIFENTSWSKWGLWFFRWLNAINTIVFATLILLNKYKYGFELKSIFDIVKITVNFGG